MREEVIQGDCLEVMAGLSDKSVDLILCDLPYGTTACKWDTILPFEPLWAQYERIIKDNGAIVLTAGQPFTSALIMSNPKLFKYQWHWNKKTHSNPLIAKKQPLRVMEDILVFYKKQPTYNPQMTDGRPYKKDYGYAKHTSESKGQTQFFSNDNHTGLRYPTNLLEIPLNKNNREFAHPTQKPTALFEYLIRTYTNEGDLVLDNCAGSGTTGVAARNLNRQSILIEKDPEYVKMIHERLSPSPLLK